MKSLVAGVLIVIVALASVLSCCHAERMGDGRDEYYDLIDWLSAVKRGSKSGLGRSFCKVDQDNAHNCRRGYNCNALRGGACSRDGGWCVCRIHDDISWLL